MLKLKTRSIPKPHLRFRQYGVEPELQSPNTESSEEQCPSPSPTVSLPSLARSLVTRRHYLRPQMTPYLRAFEQLAGRGMPRLGRQFHAQMTLRGLVPGSLLGAKLIAVYASSGDISAAVKIFRTIEPTSLVLFNSLIRAFASLNLSQKAVKAYLKMRALGFHGDHYTYPFLLKSVSDLRLTQFGKNIHTLAIISGLNSDSYVGTSLIDMYVKSEMIGDARKVFDEMPNRDVSTHNALIAGYMKAGEAGLAEEVFEAMETRNVVSWTAMVSGYAQNGLAGESLGMFERMVREKERPNWVTMRSVLAACSQTGALGQGRRVHELARTVGLGSDGRVNGALVAMYARCGSLVEARGCFDGIEFGKRDVSAWNAMITAYASHGKGLDCVSTFEDMVGCGVRPDGITFASLLSGCRHSGLVDVGIRYFNLMGCEYGVKPESQHYACVVDLLGRAGRLSEAKELINRMPTPIGASAWGSLLAASQRLGDLETAKTAAEELFVLEPLNAANYVHLSNMYAEAKMWTEASRLRALAVSRGLRKSPGRSWTEARGEAHLFVCGDDSHPQSAEIYAFLAALAGRLRAAGYEPDVGPARHDISEEEREASLAAHSERLAIAFAVLNLPASETIRVTKNIRVCIDCHAAIKAMSKVLGREIFVRDLTRFHHFVNGSCSCGDFW